MTKRITDFFNANPKKRTKTDQINKDETVKLSNIFRDYIKPGCSTNTHIKNQESEITLESHHRLKRLVQSKNSNKNKNVRSGIRVAS